jgi:hypothetical protein
MSEASPPTAEISSTLAAVPVPESEYKADLALLDRFQGVSAEIIRLSLLGIGVLGFVLKGIIDAKPTPTWLKDSCLGILVCVGALLFALSSFAGLLHRYLSADGFYYHIKDIRVRGSRALAEGTLEGSGRTRAAVASQAVSARSNREGAMATAAADMRNWRYEYSGYLLFAASILLGIGGLFLAAALARLVWIFAHAT